MFARYDERLSGSSVLSIFALAFPAFPDMLDGSYILRGVELSSPPGLLRKLGIDGVGHEMTSATFMWVEPRHRRSDDPVGVKLAP